MDQERYNESIANADLAYENDNYVLAKDWYDKALEEDPDDIYALSRAGAASAAAEKTEESFKYFQRALELDPENGDNHFNMGNAYFFAGDIPKALESYSNAEIKGCSDDVKARLYYQLALICTLRNDVKSALANYKKLEEFDKTGESSLSPDVLSEKVKLYMMIQDIDNAEKVALQWLNIAPSDIRCYMVYFNILMSKGEYDKAEKTLEDAEKFANDNEENALPIESSRVMLYITVADVAEGEMSDDYNNKAYGLLTAIISSGMAGDEQANELKLTLAELCMKMGRTDEAIEVAESLTDPNKAAAKSEEAAATPAVDGEPSAEELDEMLSDAMEKLDEKIANDEVQIELDDEGNPIADVDLIGDGTSEVAKLIEEEAAQAEAEYGTDFGDRLEFILLSCYALKENYKKVIEISRELKNSDNEYYSYFSHYSEAFSVKQLADRNDGFTKEEADRIYEEKIAYFRSKMINKEGSAFAVIFRARMYAETGKFAKAEEMASLMSEEDKASVDQYIEMCKEELSAK